MRTQIFRQEAGVTNGGALNYTIGLDGQRTWSVMIENNDQKSGITMRQGGSVAGDSTPATRKVTFKTQANRNGCLAFTSQLAGVGAADAAITQSLQVTAIGPVFVDQTAAINSAGANDVTPYPGSEAVADYFTCGYTAKFSTLKINTGTGGTVGTVVWEYWNGTAWAALAGVADGTNHFRNTGLLSVTYTMPTDWAPLSLNGGAALYHVRARCTVVFTVNPLITQGFIGGITAGNNLTLEITAAANQTFAVVDLGNGAYKINLRCGADGYPNQLASEVMIAIANAIGDGPSFRAVIAVALADGSDGSAPMAVLAADATHVLAAGSAFAGGCVATTTSTIAVKTSASINGPWSASISSTDLDTVAPNVPKITFQVDKAVKAIQVQVVGGGTGTWLVCTVNVPVGA